MRLNEPVRLFSRRRCLLVASLMSAMIGCSGAVSTPAAFEAGAGGNPLDGGVISDDGNTLTFELNDDSSTLSKVDIETPSGDEVVAFRGATGPSGEAIPSQISTARGNEFEYDDSTGVARVTASLLGQPMNFEFQIDNPFEGFEARASSQQIDQGDCAAIRDSVDGFCGFYESNAEAVREELIRVATDLALANVDSALAPFVPGVVSDVINDFFETLSALCNGWTEMREGTAEAPDGTPPVDPCDNLQ